MLVNLELDAANPRLEANNTIFVYCCHGERLASATIMMMASDATSCKVRKQTFSASEITVLAENMGGNLSDMKC